MALRTIVKDGDPVLKKKCRPVADFNDRLHTLLDDMAETMLEADGLGLAGPQVGVMRRVFVALDESHLPAGAGKEAAEAEDAGEDEAADAAPDEDDFDWHEAIIEFINPEIIRTEGEVRGYEGCLSFPGQFAAIARPQKALVRAQDRFGNPFEYEATGMMARCVCHETNHLDGITIDDLAEYFYDPEEPHDLDDTIGAGRAHGQDDAEDDAAPRPEE